MLKALLVVDASSVEVLVGRCVRDVVRDLISGLWQTKISALGSVVVVHRQIRTFISENHQSSYQDMIRSDGGVRGVSTSLKDVINSGSGWKIVQDVATNIF